jgi:Mrp family chromosome partitioning ATPase
MSQVFNALRRLGLDPIVADVVAPREQPVNAAIGLPPDPVSLHPEFVRLFHAVSSLNVDERPFVIQFLSATKGEGASTIAANFAQAASVDRGRSCLLVDCSPAGALVPLRVGSNRPSLIDAFLSNGSIGAAIQPASPDRSAAVARLSNSINGMMGLGAADLRRLFEIAKASYSTIVLDCPPADKFPDSLALARHCDGTVLVVRAETTRKADVVAAKVAVDRFGGQIIGLIFNRAHEYLPLWIDRFA